jgi:serine/threonine protein kinase
MLFTIEIDSEIIRDFCDEARTLYSLRHPNILRCLGVCIMPPAICLVTEFCEHGSLFDFLKRYAARGGLGVGGGGAGVGFSPLPLPVSARIMLDCASGLAFLHGRGWVHCDIKSLNFLVAGGVRVKLADVGECRRDGQVAGGSGFVR